MSHGRLAEIAQMYPFPSDEEARTHRRRWILVCAKYGGVGAEIGVFRGHFSEQLAATLRPRRLYLVDPWTRQGEYFGYGGPYTNGNTLPTAVAREEVVLKALLWSSETEVISIEDFFPACIEKIEGQLDWIYLDASHSYAETLAELNAADAILAVGGVIMGDDWRPDITHLHHGVFRAVNEFIKIAAYEFVAAGHEYQWCIRRSTQYKK